MHILRIALQIVVALGLLNVWFLRFRQNTGYRGGNAHSMKEEFALYGLPRWSMYLVGALKTGVAVCMIAGIWIPALVFPAAVVLFVLMLGVLAMHAKVQDRVKKSLPALGVLALSVGICLLPGR